MPDELIGLEAARARADARMRGVVPPEPPPAPAAGGVTRSSTAFDERARAAAVARQVEANTRAREIADGCAAIEQRLRDDAAELAAIRERARGETDTRDTLATLAAVLLVAEAREVTVRARRTAEDLGIMRQQQAHTQAIGRAAAAEADAPHDALAQARASAELRAAPPIEPSEAILAAFGIPSPNATTRALMGGDVAALRAVQRLRLGLFDPAVSTIT